MGRFSFCAASFKVLANNETNVKSPNNYGYSGALQRPEGPQSGAP